ncbi:MAG: polysaccharide biosynthesis/export family protein [Muribaculaceae bacterium]|nr:polysaccharide biosynthesis/export family protein [Muribaculaceae bacterium]
MKNYIKILPIVILVLFSSCMSVRKQVPYMVDAETIPTEVLSQTANMTDPVIGPGDLLNIEVTGTDMMAVSLFNKGKYLSADGTISQSSQGSSGLSGAYEKSTQYYLVDKDGNIEFPIVGKLNVGGLKKNQIIELIQSAIYPKYIKEVPAIDARLMNFRVTVLGAVKGPGIIESKTERLNLLEAIAEAGDLDIKGKRENIMLIRTNANGQREIHRLNLNDKEILLSPYFNLQQNDIIYVEPNKSATYGAWQLSPAVGATITIVGGISAIAGLVVGLANLLK